MKKELVIKFLREERKMSQQKLADDIGINRATLSQIETGVVLPTADILLRIARALDCFITDLYKEEDLKTITTHSNDNGGREMMATTPRNKKLKL